MKAFLILAIAICFCSATMAQAKSDTAKKPVNNSINRIPLKPIPPHQAIDIRKELVELKMQLAELNDAIDMRKQEIDDLMSSINIDAGNTKGMDETENMKLQTVLDRVNKMLNSMSNSMKRISATQQQIVHNTK